MNSCTDCKHCLSFDNAWRIACGHPDLPSVRIYDYRPVGEEDADLCLGFTEGKSMEFSFGDLLTAQEDCDYSQYTDCLREYAERHMI